MRLYNENGELITRNGVCIVVRWWYIVTRLTKGWFKVKKISPVLGAI